MSKGKLSAEGEVLAAYGAAMVAAFQVLINCLEESDALLPGQFPDALRVYMEMVKSRKGDVSDMTGQRLRSQPGRPNHGSIKFNLMVAVDCEPTSASRASALNRHVDRVSV